VGCGHLYQGTYKSFPVESDEHLLAVLCYVEANALRAGLVERAEEWRWSSLWRRRHAEVTDDVPPLTRPASNDVPRGALPAQYLALSSQSFSWFFSHCSQVCTF
jgi:hypothetical protein